MTELGHAIIVCPLFPGTRVDSMKVCPGKKMEAASDRFVWLDYLVYVVVLHCLVTAEISHIVG